MSVIRVAKAGTARPFGDERTVNQAFPSTIPAHEADPFLMCDHFAMRSDGVNDVDDFPVDWHPHRGQDILSYIKRGVGRHADSMGNRQTFASPGIQWCSCGSGIEHAEGGATPQGDVLEGFQIWINVPANQKLRDPRYGTHPPEDLPQVELAADVQARLLAGVLQDARHGEEPQRGPFEAGSEATIADFELGPTAHVAYEVPQGLNTVLLYIYKGSGLVNGQEAGLQSVAQLNASSTTARTIEISAGGDGMEALLFAGKRLDEPIAWHGPIVMSTEAEVREAFHELQSGAFPPRRVAWDYRRLSHFPPDHPARRP